MAARPLMLRHQLLIWLTIPLSILWMISSTVDYNIALQSANRAYDQSLQNKLMALVKQVAVENGRLTVKLPPEALAILNASEQDRIYWQVRDGNHNFVYGYIDLPLPQKTQEGPSFEDKTFLGENIRLISLHTKIHGMNALVQIGRTTNARKTSITEMLISMVIPQALIVLMTILSVWYVIGRSLAPLIQIHDEIARRSHIDLSPVSQNNVPLEIQPLIQGFNELISRLSL